MKKLVVGGMSAASVLALALFWTGTFSTVATLPGCASSGGSGKCKIETNLDTSVCNSAANFTTSPTTSDNDYFPFSAGQLSVLAGTEGGEFVRLEINVTARTKTIDGIAARVITETEYHDGELAEISDNYYAQADDGTVCYLGETTDVYENGEIVSHEGAWRADDTGSSGGIFMPADPQVGDAYAQEDAPDVANDLAEVTAVGETLSTDLGDYTDTVSTTECTPLEKHSYEDKVYAKGVGVIYDEPLKIVSFTP